MYQMTIDGTIKKRLNYIEMGNILSFLYPHTWEEIEWGMRWNGKPFEYTWHNQKHKIEFMGE